MWTYPGFVFCPRKPWDTGKKHHAVAGGLTSIIFYLEMVEGKAKDLGQKWNTLLAKWNSSDWKDWATVANDPTHLERRPSCHA
jgi:hypothetical protein